MKKNTSIFQDTLVQEDNLILIDILHMHFRLSVYIYDLCTIYRIPNQQLNIN